MANLNSQNGMTQAGLDGALPSAEASLGATVQPHDIYKGSPTEGHRPTSLQDALRLLDDAILRDGANLQELVTAEFENLRGAITELSPQVSESVRQFGTQAYDVARSYASQGMDRGRIAAKSVDTKVHENPWPLIGGVAVGALALGFFLGRGRDSGSPSGSSNH